LNEIIERNLHLTQHLYQRIKEAGLKWTPFAPENRSPIVSVPVNDPDGVMGRLRAANVVTSLRAGAVRLLVHFYNLEAEIDRVIELIAQY